MNPAHILEYSEAKKIVDLIVGKAEAQKQSIVVAVTDAHGELLAFARMDGAPLTSIQIACNKSWTAARNQKPSQEIGERVRRDAIDISYYGDPRITGFVGGIPLRKNGEVVGGIGVSGLSSAEDAVLAEQGAKLIG